MKKEYIQPTLTAYGNVEQLTQANGNGNANDAINFTGFFTGSVSGSLLNPPLSGSGDLDVFVPRPPL